MQYHDKHIYNWVYITYVNTVVNKEYLFQTIKGGIKNEKNKKIISYVLASTMIASVSIPTFIGTYALASEETEYIQTESSNDKDKNLHIKSALASNKSSLTTAPVSDFEDLKEAVENGEEDIIIINNDITFTSSIEINRPIEIKGIDENITLTNSPDNEDVFFKSEDLGTLENLAIVKFSNLKFIGNGKTQAIKFVESRESTLELDKVIFENNRSEFTGGAVEFRGNSNERKSNLTVTGCQFRNNSAKSYGGALYADCFTNVQITDTIFELNKLYNTEENPEIHKGGAVNLYAGDYVNISESHFEDNTATEAGGAINIDNAYEGIDIYDSEFI